MQICFATGDVGPRSDKAPPPPVSAGALHPGYFFEDAAADERLGLNAVLRGLGAAMDAEAEAEAARAGGAAPGPEMPLAVEALAPIAARALLCFIAGGEGPPLPDLTADDLLPLDRDTIAHRLAQAHPLAPVIDPRMPPPALALARALAGLAAPAPAFHWLLAHRLLPALCEAPMLEALREARAPLFSGLPEGPVLPLEFALALLLATPERRPAAERLALSYWLNIPTAQGVLTALRQADSSHAGQLSLLPRLERSDLNRGEAGAVLVEHDLHKRTPLWFYLWREKALLGAEGRLGPLGARLLAEGMLGLIACAGALAMPFGPDASASPPEGALEAWGEISG